MTRWLLILAMMTTAAVHAAGPPPADQPSEAEVRSEIEVLRTAWRDAREGAVWRSPTLRERRITQQAVLDLVEMAPTCPPEGLAAVDRALRAVGLRATPWPTAEAPTLIVVHEDRERRGSGLLALRCGEARPVAWQAPHSFFDLKTGVIVRALFAEGGARLALWNTVHRYRSHPGEEPDEDVHPADVAREPGSLFHAATVAAAAADPALRFVQIHGFAAAGREHDIILSTGDPERPATVDTAALRARFGRVAVFGVDADILGAAVNVQGRALRSSPRLRFLHVELSRALRTRLARSSEDRWALQDALLGGPW